jgi:ketosteroid isomerase-like protein
MANRKGRRPDAVPAGQAECGGACAANVDPNVREECKMPILKLFALACVAGFVTLRVDAGAPAERVSLDRQARAWDDAFERRDAEAMVAMMTDDVIVLPPNAPPVRGREAAAALWRRTLSRPQRALSVTIEETVIVDDYGWRLGQFFHTLPAGRVTGGGKFIEIWQRIDGEWKLHRDMFSSNEPLGVPPPTPLPSQPRLDTPEQ